MTEKSDSRNKFYILINKNSYIMLSKKLQRVDHFDDNPNI